jgi:acetyl esterase/lipase
VTTPKCETPKAKWFAAAALSWAVLGLLWAQVLALPHPLLPTGVAAVAAFYPPTDLARLSSMGYLGGMNRFLGGSQGAFPERYRLLSSVSRVDAGDPPTFLAHGGDDRIVPPGESELLAEQLQEEGVSYHLVELPWANHTFDFLWGGWSSQITRSALEVFLEARLQTLEENPRTGPSGR